MENLSCPKCNSKNYKTEKKSIHLVASCIDCGSYIKNIPIDKPKLYFGRYKGIAIDDITDLPYLEWVIKNVKQTERMRGAVSNRISELHYNLK